MRHCSTDGYWPTLPGYTTAKARKQPYVYRDYALNHHLEHLPSWIVWGGEHVTRVKMEDHRPELVTVTRCSSGRLTTVMHVSTEGYPRP